jgi:nucleoside-diphosphate kinase
MSFTKPIKEERYVFECEWYDPQADIVRHYRLFYYPCNNSIEMYDKKVQKVFLKRIEVPTVKLSDLYIGAKVTIFSRVLYIVAYGDLATGGRQETSCSRTFGMIKPCSYQNMGKILDAIQSEGF